MTNVSGQSIAAIANSVSKNGKGNTAWGAGIFAGSILVVVGGCGLFKVWQDNNKHKKATDLATTKSRNKVKELERKAELKKEEDERKAELKRKELEFRASLRNQKNADSSDVKEEELDDSVTSFDELMSGESVDASNLRMGFRSFHIGQDCGVIGRSNIGKTTFLFNYVIALVSEKPELGLMLSPDWHLTQQMKVLYFAFEQNQENFKVKYGKTIKSVPNLYVETGIAPNDFLAIRRKIEKMQNSIGNHRLLVVFDNITAMNKALGKKKSDKQVFFQWLEDYRKRCDANGTPITYLKVYHTQSSYMDHMSIEITSNYGSKADTYFTHDLVGFGMANNADKKTRYIKELKNKTEHGGEKQTLSVFKFADTEDPLYEYVNEAEECDILPAKDNMVRGCKANTDESELPKTSAKRGRKEKYGL